LSIPLSTIQRRVRHLLASGIIKSKIEVDYQTLGFKTGLIHIYLKNGSIDTIAKKIHEFEGITSIEIHIGNSDILGNAIYKDGKKLLNLISKIKDIVGVDRIMWSERIYRSQPKNEINIDLFDQ
jgi:DNA-binding Lrp family transcriptional regulator